MPWGQKAFRHYLGEDTSNWLTYDSVELLKEQQTTLPILIDQGEADPFLKEQLQPHTLQDVVQQHALPVTLRMHPEYDHSYFFIQSFIDEHLEFHAQYLST